jgi:hypothetical protein
LDEGSRDREGGIAHDNTGKRIKAVIRRRFISGTP